MKRNTTLPKKNKLPFLGIRMKGLEKHHHRTEVSKKTGVFIVVIGT